jgi:hypothetical protein
MKGIVFTTFNDMLEQKIGLEMWGDLLGSVQPESGGAYTSAADFSDQELLDIAAKLSNKADTPVIDLVNGFGQYLFHVLAFKLSVFTNEMPNLMEFLKSIDDVIRKEVRKPYQNSNLPSIDKEQPKENSLTLPYHPTRKLCHLAECLINGATEHYETNVKASETAHIHNSAEKCTFFTRTL